MKDALYFASGTNSPAYIQAFAEIGHPVGVTVPDLSPRAVDTLGGLAGLDVPVFVDSGAFSEVAFNPYRVVKPISHKQWLARLGVYERLAGALGDKLWVVAPDLVGDQQKTLERMRKYAPQIKRIRNLGANVIFPLQLGELTPAQMYRKVRRIYGEPLVAGIPMKKGATPEQDLFDFIAEIKPSAVHLLGMGDKNRRAPFVVETIAELSPKTFVSLDSCLICRSVGKGAGKPRPLTAAQQHAEEELLQYAYSQMPEDTLGEAYDYIDAIMHPPDWMNDAQLRGFGKKARLGKTDNQKWLKDPEAFLEHAMRAGGKKWSRLKKKLDDEWMVYFRKAIVPEKLRRAVRRTFAKPNLALRIYNGLPTPDQIKDALWDLGMGPKTRLVPLVRQRVNELTGIPYGIMMLGLESPVGGFKTVLSRDEQGSVVEWPFDPLAVRPATRREIEEMTGA